MPRQSKLLFCLHYDEIKENRFSNLLNYIYPHPASHASKEYQNNLRDSFRLILNKGHYLVIFSKSETRDTVNARLKQLGLLDHEVNRTFFVEGTCSIANAQEQFNITDSQSIYLVTTDHTAIEKMPSEKHQVLHINPPAASPNCLQRITEIINSFKNNLPNVRILHEAKPEANKDEVCETPISDSPPDMRPKLIKHLNNDLSKRLPLGKLAQLGIAFTLGLSLATATLGGAIAGFCLISALSMADVMRYKIQSQRMHLQLRRLEMTTPTFKETEPEIYDLGFQSKNWVPYLKSYINPKTYKNQDAFNAGLADGVISELELRYLRKGL
jgi:hypothetical protein